MNERPRIILGVTGSVAAKLTPKLVAALQVLGDVDVVATKAALYFWDRAETGTRLWTDDEEWPGSLYVKDQDVPHIKLGDEADILVIAPLTANTLAKMAHGLADNLLTSLFLAWPIDKPIVIAPAMNTRMWENLRTRANLGWFWDLHGHSRVVDPVAKKLACGTTGKGAMADIAEIVTRVRNVLRLN